MTHHRRRLLALALVASVFCCPLHNLTQAAPGDLDRVFGTDTIVDTNFFDGGGLITAVAVLPDGKVLAAGSVATSNQGFNSDFGLARYNADGSLDSSFGEGGKQTTEFSGFEDMALGMAIQPDNKIVLAGTSRSADGQAHSEFALARYNPDGSLDASFGAGGKVTTDIAGLSDFAHAVALQPDGKIVVAGDCVTTAAAGALVRYNADGSLDAGFGAGGKVISESISSITAIALRPDGKIIAAGYGNSASPKHDSDFMVLRYSADGGLDTSFGSGGRTVMDFFGLNDFALSCALTPDGKIILGGRATRVAPVADGDYDFGLARYNENGSLDFSFGDGGKVLADFSSIRDDATRITLQPDGKTVVVGEYLDATPSFRLALARFNPDGGLDASFGARGKLATTLPSGSPYITVALQGDGKVIVGGAGGFTLVRYNPDGSRDPDFHSRGTATTDFFNLDDAAYAVAVQSDGKTVAAGYAQEQRNDPMFALTRYNLDGSLDSSFGTGGKVTDTFGRIAYALLIQPDGRIVVGGGTPTGRFGLMRFNADGRADKTFGKRGRVETAMSEDGMIRTLALQPDGRIVAVGTARLSPFNNPGSTVAIARYNPDGSLDATFGVKGKVIPPVLSNIQDEANAVGLQPDGKIVVAGSTVDANSPNRNKRFLVTRYNSDGSQDAGFGNSGRVTNALTGFSCEARALAIQPDGKLVVGGYDSSASHGEDFALLRYDQGGNLDASFGVGGIVTADFFGRGDIINGLALAAGGRIIAAGITDHKTFDFIVAVYRDDGSPDPGFGVNGKVTTSFALHDVGNAIALAADGSIVVAGSALFFNQVVGQDFAVARYEGFPGGGQVGPTYNLCLQDEATGELFKLNSQTGDYQFTRCGAQPITLAGRAKLKLKKSGCLIKLSHVSSGGEVTASINTCRKSGAASVRIAATGQTFAISDSDISNNSCACP